VHACTHHIVDNRNKPCCGIRALGFQHAEHLFVYTHVAMFLDYGAEHRLASVFQGAHLRDLRGDAIGRAIVAIQDAALLHHKDCIAFTADNGLDGLAVLVEHPVQVVILDQDMDGMDGQEFLRRVTERYPDTICMLLSGSIRSGAEEPDAEIHRFLSEP
jgi:CheY-like chemotaxis protein